ncbi:flagellar assembly protein A [Helicobacter turcicus]|uniref:FapA family protein n=1 Tax=Helicobacter turcicus TaxID=2867412 RepID=A0ABS7JNV2_9HELI|nr:flagellar assembly protein A [Helicobacter turcicus]MBX7491068.1 FapA family protein [Helicobacter turcicus]MBX7545932.1 FapA family protein [Helicobacter turcicus]
MQFQSRGFKVFNDITNLRNTLLQLQKKVGEEIDFYLLGFRTFYSKKGENKYKPISDVSVFAKNANFIANIDIKQVYSIEVCKKSQKPKRTFGFKLFPHENTILRAVLLCNDAIKYHDSIKEEIYQELYKTMILQNYLIGIREYSKLSQQIDAFIFALKQGKIVPKITLNIGVGVESIEGKDGVLECFFTLQNDPVQQPIGSFQPRVCMQAVNKGDEIFTYTKPINGQIGRNLKGEFIPIKTIMANVIQTDSSIRARSDSNIIKYQAAKDGFLKETKPFCYTISDELNTTKTESSKPTLTQKESLSIDGQTHSNAKIQTDIAFIGSHRGEIKAHTVVIDVLEKGMVEAKVAYINSTLGGKIIADYIYIKDVRSYNEIYPRFSLVVDNILGEHNTFELNPAKFAFTRRDRIEYMMLSDQIKIRLRHLKKQMDEVYAYLLASQGKAHKIQHDAEEKPNEKLPKNLQCIVDQYEKALEQYKHLLLEYRDIINLYYTNEVRLKGIDEGALFTKMIIRGEISEPETMVKFKTYTGKHEETLKALLSQSAPAKLFEVEKEGDFFRLRSYQDFDPTLINWIEEKRPKKES